MISEDQKWPLVHEYRTAAVRGQVPAILCPDDGDELVPTAEANGDPALRCLNCKSVYSIAYHVWEGMLNNLSGLSLPLRMN